ncbi:MAG: DNA methyltransferase [Phycisphaeraceae bacterium]
MTSTTTTSSAPATITDSRFEKLKAKLRELFELDKSDLDFGIYRIMAAKNKEVTEFLDRQLKGVVKQTLAEHGAGESDAIQAELDETITNLKNAEVPDEQIETNKKVTELLAKLAAAGGKTGEQLEADIYNHLLAFFGRYYDEGDFISQRRYKGDTYAVPYSGEEVTLHWANKDQYYIKSGEWHKDYRFKLDDGRRVRFSLVDATQETGNNKESDEAKRRYILVSDEPVFADGDTLTLRFEFREPTAADHQRLSEATRIFGGEYDTPKSKSNPAQKKVGDERTQFCADAERRALEHVPGDWLAGVTGASPTGDKPDRTLLGQHLDTFTARNTFDYFIHKDLGGFLRRELDFYIKNEVVRLDDLDDAPANHLQQIQGRVKAIRKVATKVIDLLDSLENFQKKLWLKKKFVLNTSWLVTIDRVPVSLREVIAANKNQWAEWERLGFKPADDDGGLFGGAKWATREYLDACDKLVVDTRLYDHQFVNQLLASDEVLGEADTLDTATTGLIINSENYQALRLIGSRYRNNIAAAYLDPPYNTDSIPILYKNGYKESSWLSLIADRIAEFSRLTSQAAPICQAIDDVELDFLCQLNRDVLRGHELHKCIVEHYPGSGTGRSNVSRTHEYAVFSVPKGKDILRGDIQESGQRTRGFRRSGTGENNFRPKRHKSFYAILVDPKTKEVVGAEPYPPKGADYPTEPTAEGYLRIYPIGDRAVGDNDRPERVWSLSYESAPKAIEEGRITCTDNYVIQRHYTDDERRELLQSIWHGSEFSAVSHGTNVIQSLFNDASAFSYPKSVLAVVHAIESMIHGLKQPVVIDFYGGSGTTAHAVRLLNDEFDELCASYIVVEMGAYFETIVRPRVAKITYSTEWENGKAVNHQSGVSTLVKCFALESYEDALQNLPTPTGEIFNGRSTEESDALIRYALDLELGPHLLDLEIFRDPWGHVIDAQLASDDEVKRYPIDLVETFNYLLGLKVSAYGPIEQYSAEFEQAEHDDGLGRLKIKGRLKRDPDGPFVFQRVEGVLNDANDTRVLVVWRKLTDNPDQDAAVLDAWMSRHRETTTERTEHRDYHEIYINGPVTLPQPTAEIRTVYPIEEAFKRKMFEDTDGEGV